MGQGYHRQHFAGVVPLLLVLVLGVVDNNRNGHAALAFSAGLSPHQRSPRSRPQSNNNGVRLCASDGDACDDAGSESEATASRARARPVHGKNRRGFLKENIAGTMAAATASSSSVSAGKTAASATAAAALWTVKPSAARAANKKSRTEGYAVQHTEREWAYLLSGAQYNILRKGGTERQKSSVLHTFTAEDHVGTYVCAGCNTPLFASEAKFSSGTGWPSYATALEGVEVEKVNPIVATLDGREVRCGTCGGHLGDLFNDGWIFAGTPAFDSGKRYCIDGAALVFKPASGDENGIVYGDQPPPNKMIQYEPSIYRS
mmetsp:Transcript_8572/g.17901  ORF Transcript_8572/g.17901 Transcript_8572/m.17901 type:complete len:317 (+) Transcript_8572:126-1076(+)|eukprot:CAMPEP_0201137528 /NCGR_PEP_ID=MMETSP0850-20130426/55457_1 /ASSEMBLY_ACC=CAM_ASM_000622 /TAXON_ID=183588 /ORGANISM="Pseudo-nitzschia fraudulenta, Strain WWA7" /LENGTH=316 /DNA_ID=CAMNT_0047408887 /DNA_START=51 /DNA_END=1004 /DNA_ORIENTATION=-